MMQEGAAALVADFPDGPRYFLVGDHFCIFSVLWLERRFARVNCLSCSVVHGKLSIYSWLRRWRNQKL